MLWVAAAPLAGQDRTRPVWRRLEVDLQHATRVPLEGQDHSSGTLRTETARLSFRALPFASVLMEVAHVKVELKCTAIVGADCGGRGTDLRAGVRFGFHRGAIAPYVGGELGEFISGPPYGGVSAALFGGVAFWLARFVAPELEVRWDHRRGALRHNAIIGAGLRLRVP